MKLWRKDRGEAAFDAIVSAADEDELSWLRKVHQQLVELLNADGHMSAVAIYTDGRAPQGDEWESTGSEIFGMPVMRQAFK